MFLSEAMMRAIHADRVREIERATRAHALLAAADDEPARTEGQHQRWAAPTGAARRPRSRVPA